MRNPLDTRKAAQLKRLLARLEHMLYTGSQIGRSGRSYRSLGRRLRRLVAHLPATTARLRLRPALVAALSAIGVAVHLPAQAQVFDSTMVSPFGLAPTNGYQTTATLVDIDMDGDLDLFSGLNDGKILYAPNTGTATAPAFGAIQVNPFTMTPGTSYTALAMADMDNDGDLDLLMGEKYPISITYLENTGSATMPSFGTPQTNPFGISFSAPPAASAYQARPALVDLDDDGDYDLVVGINYNNILYYENTGTSTSPAFAPFVDTPFGLSGVPYYSAPSFCDLDGDGDFDLAVYDNAGNLTYYENTGSPTVPAFAAPQSSPFGLQPGDDYTVAAFADLDGDGDQDCLKGVENGEFWYQENISPIPPTIVLSTDVDTTCDMGTFGPIPFTVTDPDSPISSLTATSFNQGAITTASLVIGGTAPNYTISGTTANAGNTFITIIASDTATTVRDTINVHVENCSMSIDDDSFARKFEVYPNPADKALHYRLELLSPIEEGAVLELVDLCGSVSRTQKITTGGANFAGKMEVSDLAAGIYFLRVQTELYRFNRKVIIE